MKKAISIILCLIMAVSIFTVCFTANAAGWAFYEKPIQLDTVFLEEGTTSDFYQNGYYYDVLKFSVPEKCIIDFHAEYENEIYSDFWYRFDFMTLEFYKSSNLDNPVWEYERGNSYDNGYSSGRGVYYYKWKIALTAGEYYFVIGYEDRKSVLNEEISYSLNYRPVFSNTSIVSKAAKKKSFKVRWQKVSNVTGYQIQYSSNKNMKSAKTVTIKKQSTTAKTIKNLKNKKKYYIRVRTYKKMTVEGVKKTYYGKWSSKKAIKTK